MCSWRALFVLAVSLIHSIAAVRVSFELVQATDTRIRYDPPLEDSVWTLFETSDPNLGKIVGVETNDTFAKATFEFQGTSVFLHGVLRCSDCAYAQIHISCDGNEATTPTVSSASTVLDDFESPPAVMFPLSDLDPSRRHTLTVRGSVLNRDSSSTWNLVLFRIGDSSESPVSSVNLLSTATGSISTSHATPFTSSYLTATSSSTPTIMAIGGLSNTNHSLSKRMIVGVIIGGLSTSTICFLLILICYRRRRARALLIAEPFSLTSEQGSSWVSLLMPQFRGVISRSSTNSTSSSSENTSAIPDNPNIVIERAKSQDDQMPTSPEPLSSVLNNPFRASVMSNASRATTFLDNSSVSISPNTSRPSVTPPPSYHTESS